MMNQLDRRNGSCFAHPDYHCNRCLADLWKELLLWALRTSDLGCDARQSLQHSLVLPALFPTTCMSVEFWSAAQSVWRMQHEEMFCLSFSMTTQTMPLRNKIRWTTLKECFQPCKSTLGRLWCHSRFCHLLAIHLDPLFKHKTIWFARLFTLFIISIDVWIVNLLETDQLCCHCWPCWKVRQHSWETGFKSNRQFSLLKGPMCTFIYIYYRIKKRRRTFVFSFSNN